MLRKQGKDIKSGKPAKESGIEKTINISTEKFSIRVKLNETKTAKKLIEALPVSSTVNRWGDEIYFTIPVQATVENGVEEVDVGTVAFWPPGSALCIFFGKTPASRSEKPRAASPVTVIGSIVGNIESESIIGKLREAKSGEDIKVLCF